MRASWTCDKIFKGFQHIQNPAPSTICSSNMNLTKHNGVCLYKVRVGHLLCNLRVKTARVHDNVVDSNLEKHVSNNRDVGSGCIAKIRKARLGTR